MSSYAAVGTDSAFVIIPGIYEIRVLSLQFASDATSGAWIGVKVNTGGSVSGGSSNAITKLRSGSPEASATSKTNASISGGTTREIAFEYMNPATTVTYSGGGSWAGSSGQVQPPLTVTVSPGSVLFVDGLDYSGYLWCAIYFEELRLAGSY